ncbi:MAG: 7-cyano-7-deazaguanine synthase [Cuniculiplasma sp.]
MRITITAHGADDTIRKVTIAPDTGDITFSRFIETDRVNLIGQDREFLHLICSLFILEALLRDGYYGTIELGLAREYKIQIELDYLRTDLTSKLETYLSYLITFSLGITVNLVVVSTCDSLQYKLFEASWDPGAICLFSGGADSFTGILSTKRVTEHTIGLFVTHAMLRKLVEEEFAPFMRAQSIQVIIIKIPKGRPRLQQMRGFVYTSIAGIIAHINGMSKIVVSEIGPVMFQPSYDILDEVTITTHPVTIELTKRILELFYGEPFYILTPFKTLTKAEAVSFVKGYDLIKKSNSCRSTRYSNTKYPNCGRCLGCLVRRISMIVAGIENGIDDKYAWDVFVKEEGEPVLGREEGWKIRSKSFSDLFQILNFADSVLRDSISSVSATKIDDYKLKDLFRRFALDVTAAAYLLYDKQKVGRNRLVNQIYFALKEDGFINEKILEERIDDVRNMRFKPIFSS